MYKVILSKQAQKDLEKLKAAKLAKKVKRLLETIQEAPFKRPPDYEKLVGNLDGFYSRRINLQHRLVYEVSEDTKTVKVLRMWSHYE